MISSLVPVTTTGLTGFFDSYFKEEAEKAAKAAAKAAAEKKK